MKDRKGGHCCGIILLDYHIVMLENSGSVSDKTLFTQRESIVPPEQ